METKIWEYSISKEDIEVIFNKQISDGEWNIVVDELYNNDYLYQSITDLVIKLANNVLE